MKSTEHAAALPTNGMSVPLEVENRYAYLSELRSDPGTSGLPLRSADVTQDVRELIEETYVRGVLGDRLPSSRSRLRAAVSPSWSTEPAVAEIQVVLTTDEGGETRQYDLRFATGPWVRNLQRAVLEMRDRGELAEGQPAYRLLCALKQRGGAAVAAPALEPPAMVEQDLDQIGVRSLGEGRLVAERPVLVNQRVVEHALARCRESGAIETGGAVLGKVIRLPKPLPHTDTRVVTILSAIVDDRRHQGDATRFHISPEALAEADQMCAVRGLGESVITIWHSHGWGCGECNEKQCPLAECYPSLQDYELESLFPTKALLLPIAGRKQGAEPGCPVLEIHAWQGGELRPIRWQAYAD